MSVTEDACLVRELQKRARAWSWLQLLQSVCNPDHSPSILLDAAVQDEGRSLCRDLQNASHHSVLKITVSRQLYCKSHVIRTQCS